MIAEDLSDIYEKTDDIAEKNSRQNAYSVVSGMSIPQKKDGVDIFINPMRLSLL